MAKIPVAPLLAMGLAKDGGMKGLNDGLVERLKDRRKD